MPKHLFLTGENQVGKTTLLNRLLAHWNLTVAGYRTQPFQIAGQVKGHCLVSLLPNWPDHKDHIPCIIRVDGQRRVGVTTAFDQTGADILESSRKSGAQLILMDQLGALERNAHLFLNQVRLSLEGETPVVGILQKDDFPLKQEIMARPDTRVVTVTERNRDALYWELKDLYR
ncbi:MAG: hypothetical protein IJF65_00925 [Clostridia bacterium]|nr:hypothetical protein [Clostridia bacterium]